MADFGTQIEESQKQVVLILQEKLQSTVISKPLQHLKAMSTHTKKR